MATVTAYTAERMKEIEDSCIIDGAVVLDNLHLTQRDGTVIDAGSVRGPTGLPGVSNAELDAWMQDNLPIMTIIDYLGTAPPSVKWLAMAGQTVIDAATLYPIWWSKLPPAMKHANGKDALMPSTLGRVCVGYDANQSEFNSIGAVGGEKQHILTKAELPAATVSIDPPPSQVSIDPPPANTNYQIGSHSHDFDVYTNENGSHIHSFYQTPTGNGSGILIGATGFPAVWGLLNSPNQGLPTTYASQMDQAGSHIHNVRGSTAQNQGNHYHQVDIPAFAATIDLPAFNSGPLGSGVGHNIMQLYIVTLKMIKVA